MAGPSYAALARAKPPSTALVADRNGHGRTLMNGASPTSPVSSELVKSQIKELSQPSPSSMTLTATIQLLTPLTTQTDVFLMTREYLQNWLVWAYHQTVQKGEAPRAEAAVRMAATQLGLKPPELDMEYHEPGPIDNTALSQADGCPLILRPNVRLIDGSNATTLLQWNELTKKIESLAVDEHEFPALGGAKSIDEEKPEGGFEFLDPDDEGQFECCAVPVRFYETLRASHGVFCDDGFSVSFQPFPRDADEILLHQVKGGDDTDEGDQLGSHQKVYVDLSDEMIQNQYPVHYFSNGIAEETAPIQPIEFRRKIIVQPAPVKPIIFDVADSTMSRLLQQEHQLKSSRMMASVEVYPIKISYMIYTSASDNIMTNGESSDIVRGFVLVSQRTLVSDALHSLMKVAAPETSSSCKRLWSKREGMSNSGDGFELVALENLDGKMRKKDSSIPASSQIPVGEWARSHSLELSENFELNVIVEVKRPNQPWPRSELELENRISVGDIVDAQDDTGKWYEALVREVTDDTVTVHYFGWASRWNSTIRRRKAGKIPDNISQRINSPAPLWTHSSRWREKLDEGTIVEVRDASSKVDRPRWYKGVVRRINNSDKLHKIEGGAALEKFEVGGSNNAEKQSLLLLGRTTQLLVEVEEERAAIRVPANDNVEPEFSELLLPQPPYLRWVNAYSEEICQAGTHMKISVQKDPAVVTLRYEFEHGRKPVEILKSFNNMYGSGYMKEHLRGTPPAPGSSGLHNLGNSCFLNSIVQCLIHAKLLTQYFLTSAYQNDLNRQNPLGSGGRVATAYHALLKEMWSGQYSALAPRLLKQTVANFAPQFNNSYQHDSQEFCQFLMDGLHEDCNRVKKKPYVEELEGFGMDDHKAAIETWRKHLLRHDSAIVDHCQGMHRSHLTCPMCGRESIKFDIFSSISLPVSPEKGNATIDIADCFEKFMEGEQLDDLNAWYCPNCKKHVCALKMIALWSVPDIFILHLKRFTFDHDAVTNQVVRSKIDDAVKFPIDNLDLTKHILGPIDEDAPPIYNLFGVSEHCGATANSGHYTATVRNSKDGRWYRFNDAHVGETTGDAAVTGGAYVLFYERAKGKSRWAGMEKAMKEKNIDPHGGMDTDSDGFTKVKAKK